VKEKPKIDSLKPKPGLFSVTNIVIVVSAVALSSVLAIFVVGKYVAPTIEKGKSEENSKGHSKENSKGYSKGYSKESEGPVNSELANLFFYSMEPIIVNPADSNGERYLKAKISLETHDQEVQKEIEKRLPQIKNQINIVLSSKTILQMQTNESRERLRREIQNRVNGLLVSGQIYNVYFEEFVYQ
jgi:flagellar FliL protein